MFPEAQVVKLSCSTRQWIRSPEQNNIHLLPLGTQIYPPSRVHSQHGSISINEDKWKAKSNCKFYFGILK